MVRLYTSVENDNRAAFLVQLSALLTQVSTIVNSTALSSANKAKLADIRAAVEVWVKEIGDVSAPRPTAVAAPRLEANGDAARTAAVSSETTSAAGEGPSEGEPAEHPVNPADSSRKTPAQAGMHTPAPPTPEPASETLACVFGARRITDLLALLQLLFTSGIPESARLRSVARSIARLVTVRCTSTVSAALQHVLRLTYTTATEAPPPQPTGESAVGLQDTFVVLARDLRLSVKALVGCLSIVGQYADYTDAASLRLPAQLCVDALRQARRTLGLFLSRALREEGARLRKSLMENTAGHAADEADPCTIRGAELPPAVAAAVDARVAALTALWGPALSHAVPMMNEVVHAAVGFLCSVAAVRDGGALPELSTARRDAQTDLFALCDSLPPHPQQPQPGRRSWSAVSVGGAPAESPATASAAGVPIAEPVAATTSTAAVAAASPATSTSELSPRAGAGPPEGFARTAAQAILTRVGVSYTADYLGAVAARCGDEDDGKLTATRIFADAVRHLSTTEPTTLAPIVASDKWRRRLFEGILCCLVSLQPAVLAAGLDVLQAITMTCPDSLGQEVGALYSSCLFRLLESDNSPNYVKRHILVHLLTTFLQIPGSGQTPHARSAGAEVAAMDTAGIPAQPRNSEAPLLLRLYRAYDLNVHAHQLNIVQQLITSLSRIVRQAPRHELAVDAAAQRAFQEQQQQQQQPQEGRARAGSGSGGARRGGSFFGADALPIQQQSLSSLALQGLVLTVETVARQAPLEDDTGCDVLALLPDVDGRDRKVDEQRLVDIINTSPKKGIQKMFDVTQEEMYPPGSEEYLKTCEHATLPPPATPETRAKVERVADFLLSINSLNPGSVADFLSTPAVFPLQVCDVFMDRLSLTGRGVVDAVRELLATVQLPKEGQRIERMLEFFCAAYYRANNVPGVDRLLLFPFETEQACLLLVVSVVMLNTSLHNPKAGQQMTAQTFRRQLGKCNDGGNFADDYLDDIYSSISLHPLSEVKGMGAAALSGSAHNTTIDAGVSDQQPRGFDALFISNEERRRLTFGMERQRLVSETRNLIDRRHRRTPLSNDVHRTWWCAAARDLYLSSWAHVSAVFGPAVYEGTAPAEEVLLRCVRGLHALLCTGASFALATECEATMLALLRMCAYERVHDVCISAVLTIAATSYAVNFSPQCWTAVYDTLIRLREQGSPMLPLAESVLARVESLTRLSCEAREEALLRPEVDSADPGSTSDTVAAHGAHAGSTPVTPSVAVHRVLSGAMDLIRDVPAADPARIAAGLYFLRRSLGYARITHTVSGGSRVTQLVDVHSCARVVLPKLVTMVRRHVGSDETLQMLMGFVVEVLGSVLGAHAVRQHTVPVPPAMAQYSRLRTITVDTALPETMECYEFFRMCYDIQGSGGGGAVLVRTHILQSVRELMTHSLRAVEAGEGCPLATYTILSAWRRILHPLGRALSDRESAGTEVCGLASLVLRKLVALCCGTAGAQVVLLPPPLRAAALALLADVAYTGCMCSDIDTAQECLAQLSAIGTAALTMEAPAGGGCGSREDSSGSGTAPALSTETVALLLGRNQPDRLVHRMLECLEREPDYAALHTLERLTRLLRCDREQTRAETVEVLRTLTVQLQPPQVHALARQLSEVVLEGTVGHSSSHHQLPMSDPSLVSFWALMLDVPPTMKRCSRSAFRTSLAGVLGFMTHELLAALSPAHLAGVATLLVSRCLLPILVSANVTAPTSKSLAARSITQCAMLCLSRGAHDIAVDEEGCPLPTETAGCTPLTCTLRAVALTLWCMRLPSDGLAPASAVFVGKDWPSRLLPPHTNTAAAATTAAGATEAARVGRLMDAYGRAAEAALAVLAASNPQSIAGNTRRGSLSGEGLQPMEVGVGRPTPPPPPSPPTDDAMVDYSNLLVQILPGLPRLLQAAGAAAGDDDGAAAALERGPCTSSMGYGWAPPPVPASVLLTHLLAAARGLFAALWRVTHPRERHEFTRQQQLGLASLGKASTALLPHAAIRGLLNSYVELAVRAPSYPVASLRTVMVDVLGGMAELQAATQQQQQPGAEMGAARGLGPQDQQHLRTCTVGMYQELSVVLAYWVRLLIQPVSLAAAGAGGSSHSRMDSRGSGGGGDSTGELLVGEAAAARQRELRQLALSPELFTALVNLLSPTAGSVIVTARDYFAWFIVQKQLAGPASPASLECSMSAPPSPTSTPGSTAAAVVEPGVADRADVRSSRGNGHHADEHVQVGSLLAKQVEHTPESMEGAGVNGEETRSLSEEEAMLL